MNLSKTISVLLLTSINFQISAEPRAAIPLYDSRTLPSQQGWTYLTDPLIGATANAEVRDGIFWLDTTATASEKAGFFSNLPPFPRHPAVPERLDRHEGVTLGISLQVLSESHTSTDRAGFSVIVLTDDSYGIELGFWISEVWAQTESFQHAEGNAQLPFDHSSAPVDYELDIHGDAYTLSASGTTVLTGPLRDYSGFGAPYNIPNFIFFGDDTSSAAAEVGVRQITITAAGSDEIVEWSDNFAPFEIDPEATELSLAGSILGVAIQPQEEGSLTTHFEGTLKAALLPDQIVFGPSSLSRAQDSGNWQPAADGAAGNAPANFGGRAGNILGTALAAVRDLEVGIVGTAPDSGNGEYDLSGLQLFIPLASETRIDYRVQGFIPTNGSTPLAGVSTNGVAVKASLSGPAGSELLTIPISADFRFGLLSDDDLQIRLSGQVVAHRIAVAGPALTSLQIRKDSITLEGALPEDGELLIEFSQDLKNWEPVEGTSSIEGNRFRWTTLNSSRTGFFRIR